MNNYSVNEVLAHTPPMILIDKLISYDEDGAVCEVTITEQSAFFNATTGGVPSYVGIEYMAQAIAASAGAEDLDNQRNKKIGFLLGSRKYQTFTGWFYRGDVLRIFVSRLHKEDNGLGVFTCRIERSGKVLAEAKVNVFQPQEDDEREL